MKRKYYRLLICIAVLTALSTCAHAQYQASDRSRFGVQLSFFRPHSGLMRNLSNTWIGTGIDVNLGYDKLDRPNTVLSFGWLSQQTDIAKASVVPFSLSYLKHFGESTDTSWYVGSGLDAYFATYKSFGINWDLLQYQWFSDTSTKFGVNVICGIEFGGGAWYAQAKYDKVGKMSLQTKNSIDFSGLSFTVGTRLAF